MARIKTARDRMMQDKTRCGGLLMVHTGLGKGKTTAAMGLALRMLGQGQRVAIVQFVKGQWTTGETAALQRFSDLCTIRALGEGFSWESQDRQRDIAAARAAWDHARTLMDDPTLSLLILDEINIALRYEQLDPDDVVATLRGRRPNLHAVATGRNAPAALIEAADMVTEMTSVRHHFRHGYAAQPGIEF